MLIFHSYVSLPEVTPGTSAPGGFDAPWCFFCCVPMAFIIWDDSDFSQLGWVETTKPFWCQDLWWTSVKIKTCRHCLAVRFAKGLEWIPSLEWSSETVCNRSFRLRISISFPSVPHMFTWVCLKIGNLRTQTPMVYHNSPNIPSGHWWVSRC